LGEKRGDNRRRGSQSGRFELDPLECLERHAEDGVVEPGTPPDAAVEAFGDRLNIMAGGRRGLRVPKGVSVFGINDFG